MKKLYPFNVRVYGLLIDDHQILVCDEYEYGMTYTKLPGGGLEYGEGTIDCLKREFIEECSLKIKVTGHFYTTDFFQQSVFNDSQVISIYYTVINTEPIQFQIKKKRFDFDEQVNGAISFRWVKLDEQAVDEMKLPIDKHVMKLLLENQTTR